MPTPAFTKETWRPAFAEQDYTAAIETPSALTPSWLGKVKTGSGLGMKPKLEQHWFASDKGRLAFEAAYLGVDLDGLSNVFEVQDGKFLALAFGFVDDQGSTPTTTTTLNGAVTAPTTNITVAATTLNNSDVIQIYDSGGSGTAEIRTVASGGGTVNLVLDKAIRRNKANGATVKKVVAPFTHTLKVADPIPFPLPFTYQASYRPGSAQELSVQFAGCFITDFSLNQDERDLLVCTANFAGSKPVIVTPPATIPSRVTTKSYRYADAVYTYFGSTLNGVQSHSLSMKQGGGMEWWSRTPNGEFPAEFVPGRAVFEHEITAIVRDNTLWTNILAVATGLSCTILYTRGSNDTLSINMTGGVLTEAPHDAPDEGKITVPMKWLPGEVQLVFVDSNPYY